MNLRKLLVLDLLNENDQQRIDGRTRLQKLVFLAQEETSTDLPEEYTFIPYDYGPFSANLLHEVDDLKKEGYITERKVDLSDGEKYVYELTSAGKRAVSDVRTEFDGDDTGTIKDAANFTKSMFNDLPISRLLEYVYNQYPEYAEQSVIN